MSSSLVAERQKWLLPLPVTPITAISISPSPGLALVGSGDPILVVFGLMLVGFGGIGESLVRVVLDPDLRPDGALALEVAGTVGVALGGGESITPSSDRRR
jgi:hypothetical protein